ncbi:YigZ family protein [Embleya sp. NPDC020630]|uniref:YigZ family protein n=1 Tax=unclassified Embleya TaxID=2699296 RepID=UPI0037A27457
MPLLTIKSEGEVEVEVRRSRFVCALARVSDDAQAQAFLARRRALHASARHNCSAWIAGGQEKAYDDGEPSGTAGAPMLQVLRRRELTETVAVVTRYFGGIMLGAGGLIRAYGSAVTEAVDAVGVVELRPMLVLTVDVDHAHAGRLENDLRGLGHEVRDIRYGAEVAIDVCVPEPDRDRFVARLTDLTGGRASARETGRTFVEVDASPNNS